MDAAWIAVISVAVGSLITLVGTWSNNRHQLKMLREEWKREDVREAKREESARQVREREVLFDVYSRALAHLGTIINREGRVGSEVYLEVHRWIALVSAHHYDKESLAFKAFRTTYTDWEIDYDESKLPHLRSCIVQFMIEDPRLQ